MLAVILIATELLLHENNPSVDSKGYPHLIILSQK